MGLCCLKKKIIYSTFAAFLIINSSLLVVVVFRTANEMNSLVYGIRPITAVRDYQQIVKQNSKSKSFFCCILMAVTNQSCFELFFFCFLGQTPAIVEDDLNFEEYRRE